MRRGRALPRACAGLGQIGAMPRIGHHAGREVDRIQTPSKAASAPARRVAAFRRRAPGTARPSRPHWSVQITPEPPPNDGDQHAVALRQLPRPERRKLQADVEQLLGRIDADRGELPEDRVVRAVRRPRGARCARARRGRSLRSRRPSGSPPASCAHALRPALRRKTAGSRQSLGVDRDDARAVIQRKCANEVGNRRAPPRCRN